MVDVLHEMGHIAGLRHEFARHDALQHISRVWEKPGNLKSLGAFDYRSIMQYPFKCVSEGALDDWSIITKQEYAQLCKDTEYKTFSAGDLSALKQLYTSGKTSHHGEWHYACSSKCTSLMCSCGNCGRLKNGENCGYEGMNGHWTCCMSTDKSGQCSSSHTGFWHAACRN